MRFPVKVSVVVVLLAATAAYVALNPPGRLALGAGSLAAFPLELGRWKGADLAFADVVVEELAADATLARRYADERGEFVWFVIVFHQNERYGAHDPLVCYRAHGWDTVDQGLVPLHSQGRDFDANWVLVESKGATRLAVYWWYTAGDLATADRDRFLARMASSGITSNITFGAFIRVSTVVGDGGRNEALKTAKSFAEDAIPFLPGLFDEGERDQ